MRKLTLLVILLFASYVYAENHKDKEINQKSITLPEIQTELKQGKGKELVEAYCNICHSLDYITMQPKFTKDKWEGIVNKMIKTYGAPIEENTAKEIIDYLGSNYGITK